jgi:HPt (histidine-containing phosphotransfer) domain-containing protein
LSHKLKGTGGTVGFAEFTRPAEQLQQRAQHQVEDDVEGLLLELQELSAAVQRPDGVLSGS